MKPLIMLTLALMILGVTAQAFGGPGSVVVDIVGSKADNTRIESSSLEKVELEIVGSEANNTVITPPAKKEWGCSQLIYPPPPCPTKEDCTKPECKGQPRCYPWEKMHLGVDAWYGTFWYTDINMPKWPQF